jgi:toxin ParE1/3/4
MVRVKWLISAKIDLKEIYEYISIDSKRYAKLQVDRIYSSVETLKSGIQIGKKVEEADNSLIREIIEGNYRIIYKIISSEEIHILMIHHGARDLVRRL